MTEQQSNTNTEPLLDGNEFVYQRGVDGKTIAGGMSVESFLMNNGTSPITTMNMNMNGGGVSSDVAGIFKNLVVPTWALSYNMYGRGKYHVDKNEDEYEDDCIDDDLHDRLLDLVKEHDAKKAKKKRMTRKPRTAKNNKTRKQK